MREGIRSVEGQGKWLECMCEFRVKWLECSSARVLEFECSSARVLECMCSSESREQTRNWLQCLLQCFTDTCLHCYTALLD